MKRLTETKLFIDGGDPDETVRAVKMLSDAGYAGLDGQTTNPSLVAKNPDIVARIEAGDKLTEKELLEKYKEIVQGIEKSVPGDQPSHKASDRLSISIEVYADKDTSAAEMVEQAREFGAWIESAVIKLPTTEEGLKAAEELKGDLKLNMTLCFTQSQAAAVYAATRGSKHPVFVSPFVGRLDDVGLNGVQHISNVLNMYKKGDGHVHVLVASFRRIESVIEVIRLGADAVTINFGLFEPWAKDGFPLAGDDFVYESDGDDIPFDDSLDIDDDWKSFDLQHDLTRDGLQKFADDWNGLLK